MNAIIEKLPALVEEELEAANTLHTVFHSPHEGWAVLKEEVEEARDEMLDVQCRLSRLWEAIKDDSEADAQSAARCIEWRAIRLAAEAIQVAAMARKFQAIDPKEWSANV